MEKNKLNEKIPAADAGKKEKLIDLSAHRNFGSFLPLVQRPVEQTLSIDLFNGYYEQFRKRLESAGKKAENSFDLALEVLGISYEVSEEDFSNIPSNAPLIAAANHPFGGLEGVVMGAMMLKVRRDVKILGNYLLQHIEGVGEYVIPVDPFRTKDSVIMNRKGLKEAFRWLKNGGALVTFPSGEVSSFQLSRTRVEDPPWSSHIAALARKTKATVLPVFFPGKNSLIFQLAGMVHPKLRTALLPRELLNKSYSRISVLIGKPIPAMKMWRFKNDEEAISHLRMRTYFLKNRNNSARIGLPSIVSGILKKNGDFRYNIISPVSRALLVNDVNGIPPENRLFNQREYSVYCAFSYEIPHLLREIGRLRELTFRKVGEGSGKPLDLDRFDEYYLHLFLWNNEQKEVVGAYRIGLADRIMEEKGPGGLYTHKLFKFRPGFTESLSNAIEFGRSFIRPEYQKKFNSLMLLWRGIGEFIVRNPRRHVLFGAVSISRDYHTVSRNLMVRFLRENSFDDSLSRLVTPRKPFRFRRIEGIDRGDLKSSFNDIDDVSVLISEIEQDGKGVPVLLRQYLKLNGRLLCFNVDKSFSDVVDGLLMVDLKKTEPRILNRFMGPGGCLAFQEYFASKNQRPYTGSGGEKAA